MTEINVIKERCSHITREPYEDDEWDRGNTSSSWTVEGIQLYEKKSRDFGMEMDLDVPFEVTSGTKYYLLYVVYSTGDSFGRDEDSSIEFCGLYTDIAVAQENESRIRSHYKWAKHSTWSRTDRPNMPKYASKTYPEGGIRLITDDGEGEYDLYAPWTGYFESISYSEIMEVQLRLRLRYEDYEYDD